MQSFLFQSFLSMSHLATYNRHADFGRGDNWNASYYRHLTDIYLGLHNWKSLSRCHKWEASVDRWDRPLCCNIKIMDGR